jgi:hypothetical protein
MRARLLDGWSESVLLRYKPRGPRPDAERLEDSDCRGGSGLVASTAAEPRRVGGGATAAALLHRLTGRAVAALHRRCTALCGAAARIRPGTRRRVAASQRGVGPSGGLRAD